MYSALESITQRAKRHPKERFTALAHHLTEEFLKNTWGLLHPKGAAGVDGVTMATYSQGLPERLPALVKERKKRQYTATAVWRVDIPKAGNRKKLRPLGIPTVEDRLVQAAVARILSAIYEADFVDGS